jgi:putative Mg2+ transporter-C (MgtC) family protein
VLSHLQLLLRIALAAGLGTIIGIERHFHDKPAGLRTHFLVSLAAALFMVVSLQFVYWQQYGDHDLVKIDASRIASAVVSGIGFISGGAILRTGVNVHGLSTAAGLWVATAVGLASGAGMFIEASFGCGLGVCALALLRRIEQIPDKEVRYHVEVLLDPEDDAGESLARELATVGLRPLDAAYEKQKPATGEPSLTMTFDVALPATMAPARLVALLEKAPAVRRLKVAKER